MCERGVTPDAGPASDCAMALCAGYAFCNVNSDAGFVSCGSFQ
jgi:hypothetical protein